MTHAGKQPSGAGRADAMPSGPGVPIRSPRPLSPDLPSSGCCPSAYSCTPWHIPSRPDGRDNCRTRPRRFVIRRACRVCTGSRTCDRIASVVQIDHSGAVSVPRTACPAGLGAGCDVAWTAGRRRPGPDPAPLRDQQLRVRRSPVRAVVRHSDLGVLHAGDFVPGIFGDAGQQRRSRKRRARRGRRGQCVGEVSGIGAPRHPPCPRAAGRQPSARRSGSGVVACGSSVPSLKLVASTISAPAQACICGRPGCWP